MQDNQWHRKADMIEARQKHGCGRVTNPATGKEEVVVAGGYANGLLSSTEIYTVVDDTWRSGSPLPKAFQQTASLPYEDSFLILGGHDGSCLDNSYKVKFLMSSFFLMSGLNEDTLETFD